jgi:hypothetical protein
MAEWLILLLLIPAIVVPIVLLVGFAGCIVDERFGPGTDAPFIDSAVGKDVETITLDWGASYGTETFLFTRTGVGPSKDFIPPAEPYARNTFDDHDGLEADAAYTYVARGLYGDGSQSHPSSPVTGTTLTFETTFDGAFVGDASGWEGYTLVQRIEAAALMPISRERVAQVRITLYASSGGAASIDRIFISAPATGGNRYDSAALREVPLIVEGDAMPSIPLVIPANTSKTLRGVKYMVQPQSQALLIAVDFSAPPTASAVRQAGTVAPTRAAAYWFQYAPPPPAPPRPPEAALPTRTAGYNSSPTVSLIGKVEIG